jgi:hypothetical protein
MQKGQAEGLMPLLEDVLKTAGIRLEDLTSLGVGTGPGNFTGVRIAVRPRAGSRWGWAFRRSVCRGFRPKQGLRPPVTASSACLPRAIRPICNISMD